MMSALKYDKMLRRTRARASAAQRAVLEIAQDGEAHEVSDIVGAGHYRRSIQACAAHGWLNEWVLDVEAREVVSITPAGRRVLELTR